MSGSGKPAFKYGKRDLEDHIAIAAFIRNQSGHLLSFYHKKWDFWTIPVGKSEVDETAEEATRREAREEIGLTSFDLKPVYQKTARYADANRDIIVSLAGFDLLNIAGQPRNLEPAKHLKLSYRPIEELASQPKLSDMLILYLDTVGQEHSHRMVGKLL